MSSENAGRYIVIFVRSTTDLLVTSLWGTERPVQVGKVFAELVVPAGPPTTEAVDEIYSFAREGLPAALERWQAAGTQPCLTSSEDFAMRARRAPIPPAPMPTIYAGGTSPTSPPLPPLPAEFLARPISID